MAADIDNQMPQWVLAARKFIATGRQEFLRQAIDACEDPDIQAFLSCRELAADDEVLVEQFAPLAESLYQAERAAEATAVDFSELFLHRRQRSGPA